MKTTEGGCKLWRKGCESQEERRDEFSNPREDSTKKNT